jgi:UDP-N-acetylglucosamine:LPS N-acetylglucosamine transferase
MLSKLTLKIPCVLIICEIAPMGILVAKEARVPSILVENFTWDWIYQQYTVSDNRIKRHIDYLAPIFNAADFHIQTEPVCSRNSADLITAPVSRKTKTTGAEIRNRLGLPEDDKMVLITTGGIPQSYGFLEKLNKFREITFVMPGAGPEMKTVDNLIILPHRSDFYHPDLVSAADAVIGKVGYSTLSEIYHGGVPFGYVARLNFRESESMVEFIQKQMPGIAISESEFNNGNWTAKLADLLDIAPVKRNITNGAEQISRFIKNTLT